MDLRESRIAGAAKGLCNFDKPSDVYTGMNFLAFMNIGPQELILVLLLLLLLFGAKKLPELARGMRQAVKEFQKGKDEFSDEQHKAGKSDTQIAKPDVKPAESTVARTDDQGASNVTASQPSAAVTPGDKADQV